MSDGFKLLKVLGEETKYNIIKFLLSGEKCACKIPSKIRKTQSNTSMHLKILRDEEIVKTRRDGKRIMYSIKDTRVKKIFRVLEKTR
ncbi:MAG: ArsR/SmtB family transcription factor [Candidatus Woesearchaeota archaeon]